jgi:hypothetical protein
MTSKTTRPRGFAPWSPEPASLAVVQMISDVLTEYRQYLPLTMRQVYYRLVGTRGYAKTEKAYKQLLEIANRARRAGILRFDHIRDDGVRIERPHMLRDLKHGVQQMGAIAQSYRLDRQRHQEVRLMVMCEAAGMVPQIVRVCDPYSIPVQSSGGFDSVTAKHDLARQIVKDGKTLVLHIGDHDPSGVHVFSSLAEDVTAFVRSKHGDVSFSRLAVTPEQIQISGLPTAPAKATDRRSFAGVGDDPDATVQAEAIPPDVLARIVEEAIKAHMDMEVYEAVLGLEQQERKRLVTATAKVMPRPRGRPRLSIAEQEDDLLGAPEFLSLRDIARSTGISKSRLQRWYAERGIRFTNKGGRPRKAVS